MPIQEWFDSLLAHHCGPIDSLEDPIWEKTQATGPLTQATGPLQSGAGVGVGMLRDAGDSLT